MKVTVTYALPHAAWSRELDVVPTASVDDALMLSGFFEAFPRLNGLPDGVGVNGRLVSLDTPLSDHDRVEVYRPLNFDPMVSRRRRAAHKARQTKTGSGLPL